MKDDLVVILGFDMETYIGSWTQNYKGLIQATPKILSLLSKKKLRQLSSLLGKQLRSFPTLSIKLLRGGKKLVVTLFFMKPLEMSYSQFLESNQYFRKRPLS